MQGDRIQLNEIVLRNYSGPEHLSPYITAGNIVGEACCKKRYKK